MQTFERAKRKRRIVAAFAVDVRLGEEPFGAVDVAEQGHDLRQPMPGLGLLDPVSALDERGQRRFGAGPRREDVVGFEQVECLSAVQAAEPGSIPDGLDQPPQFGQGSRLSGAILAFGGEVRPA